jgi:hypothetical protein
MKCLCLHGFTQNAESFRARTGSLRSKPLKRVVDFVFIDAPHSAVGAFPDSESASLGSASSTSVDAGEVGPRAWFLPAENDDLKPDSPPGTWVRPALSARYKGWEESEKTIRDAMEVYGPFDGIMGFSQGSLAASVALASIPELKSTVKFVVLIAGFNPLDDHFSRLLESEVPLAPRSLHVIGSSDALVTRDRFESLISFYGADPRVFEHNGGHGVPTSAEFRNTVKTFILMDDLNSDSKELES